MNSYGMRVLVQPPHKCIQGIKNGTLKIDGGAVRDTEGKIRGIMTAASPEDLSSKAQSVLSGVQSKEGSLGNQEALKQISSGLDLLSTASLALQGLNLVVSLVGFTIIGSKLNKISRQLEVLDQKISIVLTNQMRQIWEIELQRRAEIRANLENLASGIRTGDRERTGLALNELTKSAVFYQMLSESLLEDVDVTGNNFDVLNQALMYAVSLRLAISQTHAHRGDYVEARAQIKSVREWQSDMYEHFICLQSEAGMTYRSEAAVVPLLGLGLLLTSPMLTMSAASMVRLAVSAENEGDKSEDRIRSEEDKTNARMAQLAGNMIRNGWVLINDSLKKVPNVSPEWTAFVESQANVALAIDYMDGQLEFCQSNSIMWEDLANAVSEAQPFAYLEAA